MGNQKLKKLLEDDTVKVLDDPNERVENFIEAPLYTLQHPQDLPDLIQRQITWLLVQFKPKNEPISEQVEGYLEVYKRNRYGINQSRWLLFTTVSLYLVEPYNFMQLNARIPIEFISCLGYTLNNSCFGIKTKESNLSVYILHCENPISALNAIKTLNYLKTEDFIPIVIAKDSSELVKLINQAASPEEPDTKVYSDLKSKYGSKGEYLITSIKLYSIKPKLSQLKLYLSSSNLYFISLKDSVCTLVPLNKVAEVIMVINHLEFVIKTSYGDLWLIHDQAYGILNEIIEAIANEHKIKLRLKIMHADEIVFKKL
jgi:hypothetical protein